MDRRYALLLLDAPSQSFKVGFGGMPDITPEDVAFALAGQEAGNGLDRKIWLFGRFVFLRDGRALRELVWRALLDASNNPEIRKMHARLPEEEKKRALSKMIVAALIEHRDSSLCKVCNGQGQKVFQHKCIVCDACEGRGTQRWSDRKRAEKIRKDHRAYSRYWRDMYEEVWRMFNGWDSALNAHLIKRLSADEIE